MTTAIQTTNGAPLAAPRNVQELMVLAEQFAKSGYFKDATQAAQAVVKIQYGRELGIGPAASMMGIHVVQGKPTLSASLVAARIKASGKYNYRVKTLTNAECVIEFYENGQDVGTSAFTFEQAKNAGLASKDVWKAYPQNMLFSRALTNGARMYCADIFLGAVYTPEEMGANVTEDGEIIDVTPTVRAVEPPTITADDLEFDPEPIPSPAELTRRYNEVVGWASNKEYETKTLRTIWRREAPKGVTTFEELGPDVQWEIVKGFEAFQRATEPQAATAGKK